MVENKKNIDGSIGIIKSNSKRTIPEEMEEVEKTFQDGSFGKFNHLLIEEYHQLISDIRTGKLDSSELTMGHELEGSLLDEQSCQIPSNDSWENGIFGGMKDALEQHYDIKDPISGELGDFNFEINTEAKDLTGKCFSSEESEIKQKLSRVEKIASEKGLMIYLTGLLETAREKDVTLDNLIKHESKHQRYLGINRGVLAFRGAPIQIDIKNSVKSYTHNFDSIMIEALCNSFQQHIKLRKPVEDFARYMNAEMILAAPLIAVAGNSPFVNSRGPFWKDSRICIFEQSIDSRTEAERQFQINRNSFPERYYDSIEQFYTETLMNRLLLPDLAFGKNKLGEEVISYPLFRLQVGTDWRWIRPVWFGKEGQPRYMTLEFRPISAGPTVPDMMANSVLLYGALKYMVDNHLEEEFRQTVEFPSVRNNFYQAAAHGLDAEMVWRGNTHKTALPVVEEISSWARKGLDSLGIDSGDIDHYLGIIDRRLELRKSPADYKIDIYRKAVDGGFSTEEAIKKVVQDVYQVFRSGEPLVK